MYKVLLTFTFFLYFFSATDGQVIEFLGKVIPINEIVRFERSKTARGEPVGYLILEVASEEAYDVSIFCYFSNFAVKKLIVLFYIYSKLRN